MKSKIIFIFFLQISFIPYLKGQTTVWSDNFNNGCTANCLAGSYGSWTMQDNVGGTTGGQPNNWYVSCAEEGVTPPGCGATCVGDASLHVGADPGSGGDMGASFNETGAVNATYRLIKSPTINTTSYNNLTLKFDFIAFGSSACSDDRLQLWLSSDNGATWPDKYCLTSVCCGSCNGYSTGQWTAYSLSLPAAYNNNTNVKVGFHWMNNGNGSGTTPSAAIDDISVTNTTLPVNLLSFEARNNNNKSTTLSWKCVAETNFSHYEIERSLDGKGFVKIASINSKCNNTKNVCSYTYEDLVATEKTLYYRLKQVDLDNSYKYSSIVVNNATSNELSYISGVVNDDQLKITLNSPKATSVSYSVFDLRGKLVINKKNVELKTGINISTLDLSSLSRAVYILRIEAPDNLKSITDKFIKE